MEEKPKQSAANQFFFGKEGEPHINQPQPAAPAAEAAPLSVQDQLKVLGDWQAAVVKELKAINGKLNFFVILAILAIVISFLGALLR